MAGNVVGNRVGFSIDTSVDLGNSSHFFDTNDASQGYSVWTEDVPGMSDNWYFARPNMVFVPMVWAGLSTVSRSNSAM